METRAPYALIGLFVLAAIGAVFGFVYWLHNTGGLGERTVYRVRFENNVAGLLTGAAVLFNGIRVGEVIDLQLNPDNPREVTAAIAVVAGTPVRTDTHAGLEFQGLTGVPVISLLGGDAGGGAAGLVEDRARGSRRRSRRRAKHDRGGTPGAAQARRPAGGQFRFAPQRDRQPQHLHGGARAQFRSCRRHPDGPRAHDRRRRSEGAAGAPTTSPRRRAFPPPQKAGKEPDRHPGTDDLGHPRHPEDHRRSRRRASPWKTCNGATPFRSCSRKRSSRASRPRTMSVPSPSRWKDLPPTTSF